MKPETIKQIREALAKKEAELDRYKRALAVARVRVRNDYENGNSFAGDDLDEIARILEGGGE